MVNRSVRPSLEALAQDYIALALHLHNHDHNPYIYFGDPSARHDIQANKRPLSDIDRDIRELSDALTLADVSTPEEELRQAHLIDKSEALLARSAILQGVFPASFDAEVDALYAVNVPEYNEDHYRLIAQDLEDVIPGQGSLPDRMIAFRDRFVIPADRVETVVAKTLEEARARTHAHLELPEGEGITLKMSNVGDFGAFAEYLGNGQTNIHFSTKIPFHVDRIVELSTHEAYPGHHVQGTLLEAELVKKRGWMEWSILPLFGAHTVVAEGGANYGVTLSFCRSERIDYDREVVLPMTGLRHLTPYLEDYHRYVDLVERLNFARNDAARRYLYGGWTRDQTVNWLMEFGLEPKEIAEQRVTLIEAVRSYCVTYNYGLDWVTDQIERDDTPTIAQKWQRLKAIFETPIIPIHTRG